MIKIAILGYGVVGSGVAQLVSNCEALIEARRNMAISIKHILDIREFPGDPLEKLLTREFSVIEKDPEITVVVEAIGGVRHAYDLTKRAIHAKKHVVTSNKELVAKHGAELFLAARENGVHYLFEAAIGGGIPLIHPITQCLSANKIQSVSAILNGTCNYILTRMKENGFTFEEALLEAQKLGYAEQDPTDDVMGNDTARKICILASMLFGRKISPEQISTEGIVNIAPEYLTEAWENDYTVKLVGRIEQDSFTVYVEPHLVKRGHPLHATSDVYNGVLISCDMLGDVFLYGKGAGKLPTASSIMSDIFAVFGAKDPMGGLIWKNIPLSISPPKQPDKDSHFTFSDGKTMRILD